MPRRCSIVSTAAILLATPLLAGPVLSNPAGPAPQPGDDDFISRARLSTWQTLREFESTQDRSTLPTWFNLGPTNVAGRTLAIEVHPDNSDIVFTGSASGGLWKSTDRGASWTPMTDDLPSLAVSAIEIDAAEPNHMWIGTGEGWGGDFVHGVGVLESWDGGESWALTGLSYDVEEGRDIFELEYNETTGTLLCAADNGLFRSTDDGATWTQLMTQGQWKDVKQKPGSAGTYYACAQSLTDDGVYRSTDDGLTWTLLGGGLPTDTIANCRLATTQANPNLVYWAVLRGSDKEIYRSTDGGDSWQLRSTQDGSEGWQALAIAVSSADPDLVFSNGNASYRSTDGGASWTEWATNVPATHHAIATDPSDDAVLWFGGEAGSYLSEDGGATFVPRNSGLVTVQVSAINHSTLSLGLALGGSQGNGTLRYTGGASFDQVLDGNGFQCEVGSADADIVWAQIQFGQHYRSTDGGTTFVPANDGIGEPGPWATPTHMDYGDDQTLWTAHGITLYKTTTGGQPWYATSAPGLAAGRSIAQCWAQRDHLAVCDASNVFVSDDHGETFQQVAHLLVGNALSDIAIHPNDPDVMFVTVSSYSPAVSKVLKTTDGGQNWVDFTHNLPGEPCNTVVFDRDDPDRVYLGTDLGVYASFDAGDAWLPLNVGLPHVVCTDLRWHPQGYLRVGTYGRGMWELDLVGLDPSAVGDNASPERLSPLTMRIHANPATAGAQPMVRFGLRDAGEVDLALYDALGRRVRTLFHGEHEARVDSVPLDTSGLRGGVYFVRMIAGGHTVSEKLVVAR
ncbi:MAG: T9SS type A sorting domain-containing protein [Candidatus Eisenbacteria bacterium]|uniref:T9SS type A sorting domain-containing protein n=1 Tax=Eiseniibacteriota bacterium TaxID=2212470 RepID=A0A956SGV5_UNCEI|nr:T9SS type A sorting domain-containing protein [Candidatus Eisenbacteria bacterium]